MKLTKIRAGYYASADGRYATVSDGYEASQSVGADAHYEGFTGGEWAAIYDRRGRLRDNYEVGDTLDWFPTKREAHDACILHSRRTIRRAGGVMAS